MVLMKTYNQFINEGIFGLFEKMPDFKDTKIYGLGIHHGRGAYFVVEYNNVEYIDDNGMSYLMGIQIYTDYMEINPIYMDLSTSTFIIKNKSNYNKLYKKIMNDISSFMPKLYDDIKKYIDYMNSRNFAEDSIIVKIKNDIENLYEYQKILLEKGEIGRLMNIKKLNPEIESQMKDITKQKEWS